MKVFLGIDLGSTTSKAVIVDAAGCIIGRGITNTRSDYAVAARIAQMEAEFNSRFTLLRRALREETSNDFDWDTVLSHLENRFHYLQFQQRFDHLVAVMRHNGEMMAGGATRQSVIETLPTVVEQVRAKGRKRFFDGEVSTTSQFFRDLFSADYMKAVEQLQPDLFDHMVALYDRSITPVENREIDFEFDQLMRQALALLPDEYRGCSPPVAERLADIERIDLTPADYIGTGYGRQLLPFDDKHVKSEILCHAMGAHACFPETRTVLDIGGQDTKAIQVDQDGLVTSFQMNDRCAAGCGRYLGYIADEMNMSVGELGPLALKATHAANICSTCTVFAGAELREYLNLGERKENILAGLHRAIVQRAFALLARSGGVRNEFTFTGGVARNPAILKYVRQMIIENYGDVSINCHPDSIFMGALGAALFAARRR
ncbi:MAG TPA: BadF/BadG/BcrA/BcrD ATPase family protein [Candidatus Deferrimicrobium sp.]|nr:BadF/BadG/BcrA/BcrD ATPase family protein [Candidatus Deferrimicrobium sp.]